MAKKQSDKLREAKENKNDEFYTQLPDIENEVEYYKEQFNGKVVFCNCDDPFESNFFRYFALHFKRLNLKKLICTCYDESPVIGEQLSLFDVNTLDIKPNKQKKSYKIVINEVPDLNNDGAVDLVDIKNLLKTEKNVLSLLKGDGDFRSKECIELLKESDIVVTNPPFSLFREFVSQLIEYDKKFLILGNQNAISYKEFFPLIKDNKVWIGYGFNLSMVFRTPYGNNLEANRKYVKSKGYDPNQYIKTPAITWFTNLDVAKRHEKMIFYKNYNEEEYPKYDNYDAINIVKVADIPKDYYGKMGVPITFLNNYNPNQFKIIGMGTGDSAKEIGITRNYRGRTDLAYTVDGVHKSPFFRIIVQRIRESESEKDGNKVA